jgi:hypothetical protein
MGNAESTILDQLTHMHELLSLDLHSPGCYQVL